jgi:asparagine synthase (glutamine-hydrolysing)
LCGIAGIACRDGSIPEREVLERMALRIQHRGPDEEGFLLRDGVGFAFRRLRVIDLDTGSQPQRNEDGTVHVVFNGEIYNHAELREWLVARRHELRTRSDTEVLVHLWEELGPDLVHRLNGMFAFAIWDHRERSLFLARDRLGIKPLLWAETDEGLVFGSEMGCITEAGGADLTIDPVAMHQYLSWGAIPAPRTPYQGVRRLPPAHRLLWSDGRAQISRYWHPLDDPKTPASYDEATRRLRELLEDSVRLRMISDVPLGAFLSGGVDSTAIAGLMRARSDDVNTFSIGFADEPVFDETEYAREAAAFHGTRHVEKQLRSADIRDVITDVLDSVSEPFGSASLLPTYVVSRETRREMTVALSGDGADELFAGYEKYLGDVYRDWWHKIPAGLRRFALTPALRALPASRASSLGELGRKAHRFLDGVEGDAATRHDLWMRFLGAAEASRLLGDDDLSNPGLDLIREIHADFADRGGTDPLNRILFTDLSLALPTDMLRKVDTASMLNSLEVRVPFLDHRIVSFAMGMPGDWKMTGTHRKRILKDAVRDLLPPGIQKRPKAGFDVPVGEWLKHDLRDMFWDTVCIDGAVPLDRKLLEKWYGEHCSGRVDRSKILWAVFTLRWWEQGAGTIAREAPRRPDTRVVPLSTTPSLEAV